MHELSVAIEVCRIAEAQLGSAGAGRLISVGVEVGRNAGIEPDHLEFCLEALLAAPPFRGAHPAIVRIGGADLRVSYLEVDDGDSTN